MQYFSAVIVSIWLLLINVGFVSLSPLANIFVFCWLLFTLWSCELIAKRYLAQFEVR